MRAAQGLFGGIALDALGAQVDQHQMRVGAAGDDVEPALHQFIRQPLRVLDHLGLVGLEFGAQRFAEGDGLGGDHMH